MKVYSVEYGYCHEGLQEYQLFLSLDGAMVRVEILIKFCKDEYDEEMRKISENGWCSDYHFINIEQVEVQY